MIYFINNIYNYINNNYAIIILIIISVHINTIHLCCPQCNIMHQNNRLYYITKYGIEKDREQERSLQKLFA